MAQLLREALGDTLRQARTDQGRTLREVSTNARVSLGYLSEVERGQKEASSELLAAICDALDVELADLLLAAGEALRPTPADVIASTKVVIPAPTSSERPAALAAA
ncbi:helix-turn-helix transcriptional regulator [Gordonia sp. TBRC 11910]|uniref:Helix-turn-helix transcriptional regulator n=1 Tax=Gordonia asplenii TaxID=2725283 RepID=A0A848KNP0_9ACTN|nr:helix-turn-helix transcriptional regulator [Gordonia asplenii]NMN99899.1 helix-turn-helix transcriptional regulator [Gordonia asplenii]